jgi:hypothetical protein
MYVARASASSSMSAKGPDLIVVHGAAAGGSTPSSVYSSNAKVYGVGGRRSRTLSWPVTAALPAERLTVDHDADRLTMDAPLMASRLCPREWLPATTPRCM